MKEMHPSLSEKQLLDMHQSGDMSKMMQDTDMDNINDDVHAQHDEI
ncbi:hypothetical protein KP014_26620 [Paenibacillus sophorae]|uniref:Uncharacterized protein n=1 Tax=Paenibacillus sophorae TaxID=1333845 RepID=A0ABX8HAY1_9BACL|nr:hypothetical protein [Paenibacillus sophorae]QWU15406.1 hypothetical protein KP014_26620 [Paenibacillus sophorae]